MKVSYPSGDEASIARAHKRLRHFPQPRVVFADPAQGRRDAIEGINRPSARRGPGTDPGPQSAFEESMINVSCNSHYFSQLAASFIDARAE